MKLKSLSTLLLLQLLVACATTPVSAPPPTAPQTPLPALPVTSSLTEAPPLPLVEEAAPLAQQNENSIYFALGRAQLNPDSEKKLRTHAARLKASPKLVVHLVGHTDNLGSPAYNLAISEKRVVRVRQFLIAKGVRPSQVIGYGIGNERQVGKCLTSLCRQKMRRVDLIYLR